MQNANNIVPTYIQQRTIFTQNKFLYIWQTTLPIFYDVAFVFHFCGVFIIPETVKQNRQNPVYMHKYISYNATT